LTTSEPRFAALEGKDHVRSMETIFLRMPREINALEVFLSGVVLRKVWEPRRIKSVDASGRKVRSA
jgi:hypothetical protein